MRLRIADTFDGEFVALVCSALHSAGVNTRSIKQTTIQNLDVSSYLRETIPVPPKSEQEAIASYLRDARTRVNKVVRAGEQAIALVEESRQAVVYAAVTRGLDESVARVPSGLPWLSEIPAHWRLVPNRALLRRRKVLVGQRHREFTLLSLTKKGVVIRDLSQMAGKFSSDLGTSQEVRPGDLVCCLFDVPETPRTVGLSRVKGMITGAYTVFEVRAAANPGYLEAFYRALDERKLLSPLYSGLRNTIPVERLLAARTPQPPLAEQREIVEYVEHEAQRHEAVRLKVVRQCELLVEHYKRLVRDVVSGGVLAPSAEAVEMHVEGGSPALADSSGSTKSESN